MENEPTNSPANGNQDQLDLFLGSLKLASKEASARWGMSFISFPLGFSSFPFLLYQTINSITYLGCRLYNLESRRLNNFDISPRAKFYRSKKLGAMGFYALIGFYYSAKYGGLNAGLLGGFLVGITGKQVGIAMANLNIPKMVEEIIDPSSKRL